jgi:hypothetical protein
LRLALCVGATAVVCAGSADAQSVVPEARTDIKTSLTGAYEGNVLRLAKDAPNPAGFERDDYRLTPSLDIDISRPIGVQSVFLNGSLGYDFYARNQRLERERINVRGGADTRIGGQCTQHVELGYARQQSDLRDFTRLLSLRNAERRLNFSAAASCGGMFGLKPGLTYDYEAVDNSEARRRISDYRSSSYGATVGFVSPALGEISLFATYRNGSYPTRINPVPGGGKDGVKSYNFGVQYSRDLGARLKADLSAGYNRVKPKLGGVRPFKGASYSAGITWIPNDRLQVKLDAGRAVSQSNLLDVSYSIDDSYGVTAQYGINRQWKARLGGSILRRKFRDSPLVAPNTLGPDDNFKQLIAGLDFTPRRRIGFSADVATARRSSPVNRFDFNYTTARLVVRFGF